MSYIDEIVGHLRKAQEIATKNGFTNLLQPGLVKEMLIAQLLGHEVHRTKEGADAWDPHDHTKLFEYLCCNEGGSFQFDRVAKAPPESRDKSRLRLTRNAAIYCAIFSEGKPLDIVKIYEIPVEVMLPEFEKKLDASKNDISHVGFSIKWVASVGKVVYPKG